MAAAVVLVIAALLVSVLAGSGSKDCKVEYEVETNHQYRSHDNIEIIKIPKGQDVNYCKEKCNAIDNCDRFNYNGKRRKCWLKSGDEKKHPLKAFKNSDAYVKVSCEADDVIPCAKNRWDCPTVCQPPNSCIDKKFPKCGTCQDYIKCMYSRIAGFQAFDKTCASQSSDLFFDATTESCTPEVDATNPCWNSQ